MAGSYKDSSVKLLTGADFQDRQPWKLRDSRCAFVLFFAEWCGHCQNFKPEYIKFADVAQFIRVYAVDTGDESTLLKKLSDNKLSPVKITGFPTVWIYSHGKPLKEYDGPRSWQALLSEAKKVCHENCGCDV